MAIPSVFWPPNSEGVDGSWVAGSYDLFSETANRCKKRNSTNAGDWEACKERSRKWRELVKETGDEDWNQCASDVNRTDSDGYPAAHHLRAFVNELLDVCDQKVYNSTTSTSTTSTFTTKTTTGTADDVDPEKDEAVAALPRTSMLFMGLSYSFFIIFSY